MLLKMLDTKCFKIEKWSKNKNITLSKSVLFEMYFLLIEPYMKEMYNVYNFNYHI